MTDYPLWHCQNPRCYSYKRGRPRILFDGDLGPGSRVRGYCPECKSFTTVTVDSVGQVEYGVKAVSAAGTVGVLR